MAPNVEAGSMRAGFLARVIGAADIIQGLSVIVCVLDSPCWPLKAKVNIRHQKQNLAILT